VSARLRHADDVPGFVQDVAGPHQGVRIDMQFSGVDVDSGQETVAGAVAVMDGEADAADEIDNRLQRFRMMHRPPSP
jgi:hypothetical protein